MILVKSTILPLDRLLDRLITVEDMKAVGELARLTIVTRTIAGRPPEGEHWPAYSRAYAERKAEELGSGPVNLMASGEMLGNLKVIEASKRHVTLGWLR